MRALVIGRGSMGKRRIRDLTALGVEVESWDPIEEPGSPHNIHGPFDFHVVSTPPLTHGQFEASGKLFTEADVEAIARAHFPSATPLFTDWWPRVQRDCQEHYIAAYTLHVGQHLDDWHPGADKKTYYAYQGDLAGREMVAFELIWLTKLFGRVTSSKGCMSRTVNQVDIHHGSVMGHILIDTLSRPPIRRLTLVANGWQVSGDLTYSEETYAREMRAFVSAVEGRSPWPYSQAEEAANLEVLHTIKRSG